MDPNMEFVKFYGKNYDADSLANGVAEEIKNFKGPVIQDAEDDTTVATKNMVPDSSTKAQVQTQ